MGDSKQSSVTPRANVSTLSRWQNQHRSDTFRIHESSLNFLCTFIKKKTAVARAARVVERTSDKVTLEL